MKTSEPEKVVLDLQKLPPTQLAYLGMFAPEEEVDAHFTYHFFEPLKHQLGLDLTTVAKVKARVLMAEFCKKHKEAKGIGFAVTNDYELIKGIAWKNEEISFEVACEAAKIQLRQWARTMCVKLADGKSPVMVPAHTDANAVVQKDDEKGFGEKSDGMS